MRLSERAVEELAAQYALGTLRGPARKRFERYMQQHAEAASLQRAWRDRLTALSQAVAQTAPPAGLWERIAASAGVPVARPEPRPAAERARLWNSLAFWRGAALLAGLACIALIAGTSGERAPAPVGVAARAPEFVSTLAAASGGDAYLLRVNPQSGELWIRAIAAQSAGAQHDYELWLLPAQGTPASLGVISQSGTASIALSKGIADRVAGASAFAVSVEPPGGSPTGAPTGEVRYSGPVYSL